LIDLAPISGNRCPKTSFSTSIAAIKMKMMRKIGRRPHSSAEGKAIASKQREREIDGVSNQREVVKFGCFITVMRDDFWQD